MQRKRKYNAKNWVRRFRLASGLTREELAELAGVSDTTVGRAERGQRFGVRAAGQIAAVWGVAVEELEQHGQPVSVTVRSPNNEHLMRSDSHIYRIDGWMRAAMRRAGLTLNALAPKVKVSRASVADAHRGQKVSAQTARAIAEALGWEAQKNWQSGQPRMEIHMTEATKPDFECAGCGHGVFGKEPVHCIKCRGISFVRRGDVPGTPLQRITTALRRMERDAAEVREEVRQSGFRNRNKVMRCLADSEGLTLKALRLVMTATNLTTRGQDK